MELFTAQQKLTSHHSTIGLLNNRSTQIEQKIESDTKEISKLDGIITEKQTKVCILGITASNSFVSS